MRHVVARGAFVVVAAAAAVVLASFANGALAFNTIKLPDGTSAHWRDSDMPIPYYVNSDGSGLSSGVEEAMQAGYGSWMAPSCTYIKFEYQGTTTSKDALPTDNVNNLFFVTGTWPAELGGHGVIAVTTPAIYSDGTIQDADIRFNAADFQWSTDGEAGKMDVQNIATHEEGHFLGLDHTEVLDATMYPYANKGETIRRELKEDDRNGVCYIYPNPDATGGAFGEPCTADGDCTSGTCADDGSKKFCSETCDPANGGSDCPGGYRCDDSTSPAVCLPGDESNDLCTPCEHAADCAANLCIGDDTNGYYCSRFCLLDQNTCPSGYTCTAVEGQEGGCWPADDSCSGKAQPQGGESGDVCSESKPCKAGLVCVFVTDTAAQCFFSCEKGSDTCPSGTVCHELNGGGGACAQETGDGGIAVPDIGGGGGGGDGGSGGDAGDLAGCNCSIVSIDSGDAFGLAGLLAAAAALVLGLRRRR